MEGRSKWRRTGEAGMFQAIRKAHWNTNSVPTLSASNFYHLWGLWGQLLKLTWQEAPRPSGRSQRWQRQSKRRGGTNKDTQVFHPFPQRPQTFQPNFTIQIWRLRSESGRKIPQQNQGPLVTFIRTSQACNWLPHKRISELILTGKNCL